ncbi:MAG: DNA/RNA non-specific endonuclease [Planctomycetes bacterium]|nr:DNA/RNA non-specific endonuclease [Planctomycetota bacterium]
MGPPVGLQGTDVDLIAREGYALAHDAAVKVPLWVCEGIPAEQLVGPGDRDRSRFLPDPELAKGRRAELSDYEGSGYDRGHMAPAADHKRTQQLMDETHYLSNMAPQVGIGFNRHIWAQLEDFVRGIAERRGLAYVVTGPIFDPAAPAGTIGANQVRVPTHFYKIVAAKDDAGRWAAQAFVLENRKHESAEAADWSVFIRSIDWVEERTGLDFMPLLDVTEEERLEREASVLWN